MKRWRRELVGSNSSDVTYRSGKAVVVQLSGDKCRRWFISLGLSYAANKRGDVRLFWTPEGAMRAAEKLAI